MARQEEGETVLEQTPGVMSTGGVEMMMMEMMSGQKKKMMKT